MSTQREAGRPRRVTRAARERGLDPLVWTAVVQNGKVVLGAVLAWVIAIDVLGLQNPILAPWAAVLVVHATVYRTFARGAQQVGATLLAVVLAWLAAEVFGLSAISLGVSLAVAFVVGRLPWLRDESTTLATTTIVVLGTGYVDHSNLLVDRLLDTLVGVSVGLLVNLVVWPPMRDRAATAFVTDIAHEIGDVLTEIADGLGPDVREEDLARWIAMCRAVDVRHDEAWALVRQARESLRLNPRRRARTARVTDLEDVLHGLEQAVAEAQSIVRTVEVSAKSANTWQEGFRGRWAELLEEAAGGIVTDDADRLVAVDEALRELTTTLSTDDLPASHWPEYGGLIVNLRNVVTCMLPVARWRSDRADGRYGVRGSRAPVSTL
ncbi:MAG: hypothetical protein JWO46_590 [Nocardioidaceae bacterium]|nr:hypothetical protein [Nocardioidaceae bacterium]